MKNFIVRIDDRIADILEEIQREEGITTRTGTIVHLIKFYCWTNKLKPKERKESFECLEKSDNRVEIPEVKYLELMMEDRRYSADELVEIFQKDISETLVIMTKLELEKYVKRIHSGFKKI